MRRGKIRGGARGCLPVIHARDGHDYRAERMMRGDGREVIVQGGLDGGETGEDAQGGGVVGGGGGEKNGGEGREGFGVDYEGIARDGITNDEGVINGMGGEDEGGGDEDSEKEDEGIRGVEHGRLQRKLDGEHISNWREAFKGLWRLHIPLTWA